MQELTGWTLLLVGGGLYLAQLISSINFRLAQKWGIQEDPEHAAPLLIRAERYVAYWDLVTLGWLPLAGVLMIANHTWWSIIALPGAAIYLDMAGREAAKNLSFRHEGLQTGGPRQSRIFFASYLVMALLGIVTLALAIDDLAGKL